MRGTLRSVIVASATVAMLPQTPTRTLSTPEVEYREPFSDVAGVRELSDGRVIVIDSRERLIHAVDMKTGTAIRVGREGIGPGEYRLPLRIFALPGDSTAIYDMGNAARPLVVTPHATAGGNLPQIGERPMFSHDAGTDARGRIYAVVRPPGDSLGIERLDRATGKRDTIARVSSRLVSPLLPVRRPVTSGARAAGGGRGAVGGGPPPPLASHDQWAVASDGRVAVVSVDPYRVTLVDERGTRTIGPVLDAGRVPVSNALKEQWRAERRRPVPTLVSSGGGQTTATSRPPRYTEPAEWPEVLPAFLRDAVSFAPDGMLWVERAVAAESPPTIDVIDRTGKLAYRVLLPKQSKLVGFGASSVYVVRVDEDDLQYLQRYRLPGR